MIYVKKLLRVDVPGTVNGNCPALHAFPQGLLRGAGLSLQAQPSSGTADHEDFGKRPALDVVAWGACD